MLNSVQLIGRLTDTVDLKYTSSENAVGNFLLAVSRNYKKENGERETDFLRCVIWKKGAELLADMAVKGSLVRISGRLQTRNYENKNGQKVYVTEILVTEFELLESKEVTESRKKNHQHGVVEEPSINYPDRKENEVEDEDLPF
ncbi:single-stranded DNA-binding protein [Enterococcus hirae]